MSNESSDREKELEQEIVNLRAVNDELQNIDIDEIWLDEVVYKVILIIGGVLEVGGLIAVFLLTNWKDPTHLLIFATAMLAFLSLVFSLAALATKRQAGEQRILRAIELLHESRQQKNSDDPQE